MTLFIFMMDYSFLCIWMISVMTSLARSSPTPALLKFQLAYRQPTQGTRCRYSCDNTRRKQVCGTDGVTYPSGCELRRAKQCRNVQVDVANRGRCTGRSSDCSRERQKAQALAKQQPKNPVFVPRCKPTGGYQQIQCHETTGYCWCVNTFGKPLPSTAKRGEPPVCTGPSLKKKSGIDKRGVGSKSCSDSERNRFNLHLIRLLADEYSRIPRTTPSLTPGFRRNTQGMSDKKVVAWKFSQLDIDGDRHLKRREVKNLRKMLKKLVRPKACAKTFVTFCDSNNDKKLSSSEWTQCLKVDPKSLGLQPPRGESWEKKTGLKAHDPRQETEQSHKNKNSTERRGCKAEREAALKMDRADPNSKIYIPECTKKEQYKREQCHVATGYCWCVLPSSGKPIPGTATHNVTPQCNQTVMREMKDCPYNMKRMFLQELLDTYTTQLVEYANNNKTDQSKLPAQNPKHSLEEHTVRWRFNMLDTNNNKLIDKREKRLLKKDLRNIKPKRKKKALRRCSREFVTFCDSNNNKQITLTEWLDCTGVTEQQNKNLPENPKRKGPNPFKKWLRSSNS